MDARSNQDAPRWVSERRDTEIPRPPPPLIRAAHLLDFLEWDVRNWSAALEFWRAHTGRNLSSCRALEIGSRNGGLSLWLALQGAHVYCSDVSFPSRKAVELHKTYGVSESIEYRSIHAAHIPYTNAFDVILFKSVLGAVGRQGGRSAQARAISEMHKALRPGGELFFAENLTSSPLHRFCRRRFVRWGSAWLYVSVREMTEFLAPFSQIEYRTAGFSGAFGRTERQRNLLGLLDRRILDRVVPEDWRYIAFGIARK